MSERLRSALKVIATEYPGLHAQIIPTGHLGVVGGKPGSRPPLQVHILDLIDQVEVTVTAVARAAAELTGICGRPWTREIRRQVMTDLDWMASVWWQVMDADRTWALQMEGTLEAVAARLLRAAGRGRLTSSEVRCPRCHQPMIHLMAHEMILCANPMCCDSAGRPPMFHPTAVA